MNKLMIVMIFTLLAACGAKSKDSTPEPVVSAIVSPVAIDEKELIKISTELSELMARGEFDETSAMLSDALKEQLNPIELKAAWDETVIGIGEYIEVYDVEFKKANVYDQVYVKLKYEKNGLRISYMFDEKAEIVSMWLDHFVIPAELASNDMFEEIAVKIGELELDGIFTVPKGKVYSVAILVHGSGQLDMDETIGASANKPFRDIAHGLAEEGIASLRYNKRYYQSPDLLAMSLTIQDEVLDDVRSAIEFVASDERVEGLELVIIGHSLGGMLTPKIALDNTEVDAAVILAGSPRGLEDIILDQNMDLILEMEFETQEQMDTIIGMVTADIERIKNADKEQPDAEILGVGVDYWKSLNEIDTPKICAELDIPFLIMQGGEDFQIYTDRDFEAWKDVFKGKTNAAFMLYENLNHLFMPSSGTRDLSDYDEANNVDPEVISNMAEWIKATKK